MNEWLFNLIEKVEEFESPEDWYNFDIEAWMQEGDASPYDQMRIIKHYYEFIERMKEEHNRNHFEEELFNV